MEEPEEEKEEVEKEVREKVVTPKMKDSAVAPMKK